MIRVVSDPNVLATMSAIDETVEIRSADGRVIGYFSPVDPATAQLYAEAAIHFDPAVIASRTMKTSGKTFTTTEVLARLEQLSSS